MPIYLYKTEGDSAEYFEIEQSMSEDTLTHHPETGEPVHKVYTAPNLGLKHTTGATEKMLDNKSIEKAGFTKYERDKVSGKYNKIVGKHGPSTLVKD